MGKQESAPSEEHGGPAESDNNYSRNTPVGNLKSASQRSQTGLLAQRSLAEVKPDANVKLVLDLSAARPQIETRASPSSWYVNKRLLILVGCCLTSRSPSPPPPVPTLSLPPQLTDAKLGSGLLGPLTSEHLIRTERLIWPGRAGPSSRAAGVAPEQPPPPPPHPPAPPVTLHFPLLLGRIM
ncbi:hypothetical protein D4764_20G0006660 [Takifugu flavidus]|uniref:Uncharacterized protein n=1 Tax=Takifugu flavidus TaxID=433684 RepID=A0A5C6NGN6_9TELE|nr:hypothetical protein D4764_20G0006660 [Takifugu flavidus]